MESIDNKYEKGIGRAKAQALFSVFLNIFLTLLKGYYGVKANSRALLSDAIHSATDVVASMATFLGIWAANKRHPSFPYGLYKAETLATLVSSLAILLAGYEIAKRALFGPEVHPTVSIALPVAIFCLVITCAFGLFQVAIGKRLGRPALIADGKDYLADSLSTGMVMLSLAASYLGLHLDRLAAFIVALFVFRAGGSLFWTSVKELLDAAIDRDTERKIIEFVESHPLITRVERVYSRGAGGRIIIDMDVVMKTRSHQEADSVADRLEEEIIRLNPQVVMARIRPHFEAKSNLVRITPVEKPGGPVAHHFAKAPWFKIEVIDLKTNETIEENYLKNPHKDVERKRGYLVGKWLLAFKPDQVVMKYRHGGTAEALLAEAGVEIITPEKGPESGANL